MLRKEGISVLVHDPSFGPSLIYCNKKPLASSFYWFIRRLKLRSFEFLLIVYNAQKMKFSIKDFVSKCDQETADLVTFAEEVHNGKLHFLYSVRD